MPEGKESRMNMEQQIGEREQVQLSLGIAIFVWLVLLEVSAGVTAFY